MALERISGILEQMRENTARLSAEARANLARETAERIAARRLKFACTRVGGARAGMKRERYCK